MSDPSKPKNPFADDAALEDELDAWDSAFDSMHAPGPGERPSTGVKVEAEAANEAPPTQTVDRAPYSLDDEHTRVSPPEVADFDGHEHTRMGMGVAPEPADSDFEEYPTEELSVGALGSLLGADPMETGVMRGFHKTPRPINAPMTLDEEPNESPFAEDASIFPTTRGNTPTSLRRHWHPL